MVRLPSAALHFVPALSLTCFGILLSSACPRTAGLQTPAEILLPSSDALLRTLAPTSAADARFVATAVAEGVAPAPVQLGSVLRARRAAAVASRTKLKGKAKELPETLADGERLTLGDDALDRLFGGGLPLDGSVTEIVGERCVC